MKIYIFVMFVLLARFHSGVSAADEATNAVVTPDPTELMANGASRRDIIMAAIQQFTAADHVTVSRSNGHGGGDDRSLTPADSRSLLHDVCAMMRAPAGSGKPEQASKMAIFAYGADGHFVNVIGISIEKNYYELPETGMVCMPDGAVSAKVATDLDNIFASGSPMSSPSATKASP